jgi:hypothetical protein
MASNCLQCVSDTALVHCVYSQVAANEAISATHYDTAALRSASTQYFTTAQSTHYLHVRAHSSITKPVMCSEAIVTLYSSTTYESELLVRGCSALLLRSAVVQYEQWLSAQQCLLHTVSQALCAACV